MRPDMKKDVLFRGGLLCLMAGLLLSTFYHGHSSAFEFSRGLCMGLGITLMLGRIIQVGRRKPACSKPM